MTRLDFAPLERYANLPASESPTADLARRLGTTRAAKARDGGRYRRKAAA